MNLDKESIEHMNFRIAVHAEEAKKTAFPRCDLQEIRRVLNNPEILCEIMISIRKSEDAKRNWEKEEWRRTHV